jgi:hypothetical protein
LLQELETCYVPIFTRTACGINRAEGQIMPFCPPRKVLCEFGSVIRHPLKHECKGVECRATIHDGMRTMKIKAVYVIIAQEKIATEPEGTCVLGLIGEPTLTDIFDESGNVQILLHSAKGIVNPTRELR